MTEHTTASILPFAPAPAAAPHARPDSGGIAGDLAASKLDDAMAPGFQAEFSPDEAEAAGAFAEDALSEADAFESAPDARVWLPQPR